MAHIWFMHDAHLGCALFFLDMLAEYTLLALNDSHGFSMSLVCSWNEVGMSYVQVSSSPFCTRPFWRMPRSRVLNLAAQNCESRIARFPESRGWSRQNFRSKKPKNESNRSKVESRKIDSEAPSESHPINAKATWESHDSEPLRAQRLKKCQSRLKLSISTFRIPHKK